MKTKKVLSFILILLSAFFLMSCDEYGNKSNLQVKIVPDNPSLVAFPGNSVEVRAFVSSRGVEVPKLSFESHALPVKYGNVISATTVTNEKGIASVIYQQEISISEPGEKVKVIFEIAGKEYEAEIELLPYRLKEKEDLVFSDQGAKIYEKAEEYYGQADYSYKTENYIEAMNNIAYAAKLLEKKDEIPNREKAEELDEKVKDLTRKIYEKVYGAPADSD